MPLKISAMINEKKILIPNRMKKNLNRNQVVSWTGHSG